jgi:hypothetical protein
MKFAELSTSDPYDRSSLLKAEATDDSDMTQPGKEGAFSYEPVAVDSKSGWANPIADEMARAAFMTAAARAGT